MIQSEFTDLKKLGASEETSKEVADHVMKGDEEEAFWEAIESYQCLLLSSPWSITKQNLKFSDVEMR